MKKPHFLLLILFISLFYSKPVISQTVMVSGQCVTGSIILSPFGDIAGKPAYTGTGTVNGNANVQVSVYWMPAPDNVWVLDFDGQPYFQTTCTPGEPPATGGSCLWTVVPGSTEPCTGPNPLVINGSGTLPIKITTFTARKKDKEVVLNWQTATETNNKGFEIQRSGDGVTWIKIAFINGSGNSSIEKNYQFNDVSPLTGKNFYRLLQLDIDNRASYSSIVSVNVSQQGFYSISNNPGHGLYNLHIEAGTEKVDFSVIDARGRQVISKTNSNTADQIIDLTNFSPGIYFLRIIKGTNLFTERLVKF